MGERQGGTQVAIGHIFPQESNIFFGSRTWWMSQDMELNVDEKDFELQNKFEMSKVGVGSAEGDLTNGHGCMAANMGQKTDRVLPHSKWSLYRESTVYEPSSAIIKRHYQPSSTIQNHWLGPI